MAYRSEQPDRDEQRLALLRQHPRQDFEPVPELSAYTRGMSPEQRPEAERLHARWREERRVANEVDRAAEERFLLLTIQLADGLDDDGFGALYDSSVEVVQTAALRTVMFGAQVRSAIRSAHVDRARALLAQCDAESVEPMGDTSYRLAAAMLAIEDGDFDRAVQLLGERHGDLPLFVSFFAVAGVLRVHALFKSERHEEALREARWLVAQTDLASVLDICRRNPPQWKCERVFVEDDLRNDHKSSGCLGTIGGVLLVAGGLALLIYLLLNRADTTQQDMVPYLSIGSCTAGFGVWLLIRTRRRLTLARQGAYGEGTVIERRGSGTSSQRSYKVVVQAMVGDRAVTALSAHECNLPKGSKVRILWLERYADVALVSAG